MVPLRGEAASFFWAEFTLGPDAQLASQLSAYRVGGQDWTVQLDLHGAPDALSRIIDLGSSPAP